MCVCFCSRGGVGPLPSCAGGGVGLFQRASQAWPGLQEFTSPPPPPLTSPGNCQSQTQLRMGLCVLGRPIEAARYRPGGERRGAAAKGQWRGQVPSSREGADSDHRPCLPSSTSRSRGRPRAEALGGPLALLRSPHVPIRVERLTSVGSPAQPGKGAAISHPFPTPLS